MLFNQLPHETVIYILTLSDPVTIQVFQKVSWSFRRLVLESPLLQYTAALDLCGYAEPLVSRKDLSMMKRAKMLYAHSARKDSSVRVPPAQIRVRVPRIQGLGINLVRYHGGIYAQYHRSTQILHLYQLSSLNHAVESREWRYKCPGVMLVGFAIHAELDLLVWLEALHPGPFEASTTINQDYRFRVHLHSLSTNLQHPNTSASTIVHGFSTTRVITGHTIHVLGDLLAMHFISSRERFQSSVVIWDWTTGIEIARVAAPGSKYASFAFVSEKVFVITRNSSFFEEGNHINTGTYGQLEVYSLDRSQPDSALNAVHLIVRLCLPSLPDELFGSFIRIRETNYSATSSYVSSSSRSRLYDLLPSSQILCLDIIAWPIRRTEVTTAPYGTLMISVKTILEAAMPFYDLVPDARRIHGLANLSWLNWAHETFWCDTSIIDIRTPHSASGKMYAEIVEGHNQPGSIAIWNFDTLVQRLHTPKHAVSAGFFAAAVTPQVGKRTVIEVDAAFLPLSSVMLDSEYIIAQTRWEDDGYTLLVYHF